MIFFIRLDILLLVIALAIADCVDQYRSRSVMKGERKSGGGGGGTSASKKQQQTPNLVDGTATMESPTSSASTQNAKAQQQQKYIYSETAIRNNFQVLEQSRTCQAAVSGIASGILGLTGTVGFLFYFLCVIIQAFVWNYKAGFRWSTFFASRSLLVTHSLVGGLFTYVLFWVFVYGLVHVY